MRNLGVILVVLVVAAAVVLSTTGSDMARGLQGVYLGLVSPFLNTGSAVSRELGTVGRGLKTLDELEAENRRLLEQNAMLQATNQMLRDIEAENNTLRQALDYRERSVFKLVPARVMSRDASTWWNTMKINRGFEDGLESDMPVLTEEGLVGKTAAVGKNESVVVLVTDETCKVAARVEGSVETGIVSGMRLSGPGTPGELQMEFLSKAADLQPGQKVYTAGVSRGVFPSGILLGEVLSFRARALDGQSVLVPAVDLTGIEDVFVVVDAK
jgi:rod shape-determining protein MreC